MVGSICSVLLRSVSTAGSGRSTASRISQRTRIINVLPGLGRGRRQARIRSIKGAGGGEFQGSKQSRIIHRITVKVNARKCQTGLNKSESVAYIVGLMGNTWW